MIDVLLLSFVGLSALIVVFSVLRRSFRELSAGQVNWDALPDVADQGEVLHRVCAFLDLTSHLLRTVWFVLWLGYRTSVGPFYWWNGWQLFHASEAGSLISWTALIAVGVEILVMSTFILGLLPQVLAALRGKQLAAASLPLLIHLERLFSPITRSFSAVSRVFLRVLSSGPVRTEADLAEERIRAAVEIGEREGVIQDHERTMIEAMLEFHDAEVTEVMTPRIEMVCMDASLGVDVAMPKIIECGHSRIPVYGENIDDMVGILYVKDLLRCQGDDNAREAPLHDIVRKVYFVPETKKISQLLAEFRAQRFHIAIILDEYGGTSGLVTIEDILEEIVGEIEDEFDDEVSKLILRIDENTYELDGRAHIDEVNRTLSTDLPEGEDYETVAGFLFGAMGKVPEVGEVFEVGNVHIKVTSADDRKIRRLRVRILHPQDLA